MTLLRALVVALLVAPAGLAWGQGIAAPESRVKAAFVYKFAGYVEWPEGAFARSGAPLEIAVLAAPEIAAELSQIVAGRTAQGRPIAVRSVEAGEPVPRAQVVFIGKDARLEHALRSVRGPALVITETPGALEAGAAINLLVVDGRVRFEVGLEAAERRGLRLSSRLLAVALRVHKGGGR